LTEPLISLELLSLTCSLPFFFFFFFLHVFYQVLRVLDTSRPSYPVFIVSVL
jgi:hypothetical protein